MKREKMVLYRGIAVDRVKLGKIISKIKENGITALKHNYKAGRIPLIIKAEIDASKNIYIDGRELT